MQNIIIPTHSGKVIRGRTKSYEVNTVTGTVLLQEVEEISYGNVFKVRKAGAVALFTNEHHLRQLGLDVKAYIIVSDVRLYPPWSVRVSFNNVEPLSAAVMHWILKNEYWKCFIGSSLEPQPSFCRWSP